MCRCVGGAGVQERRRLSIGYTQDKRPAACFNQIMYSSTFYKHFANIKSLDSHLLLPSGR